MTEREMHGFSTILATCIENNISKDDCFKIMQRGACVCFVFDNIAEWAKWWATEWTWRTGVHDDDYCTSNPDDWEQWLETDNRFVKLDDGRVVELGWQDWYW